jgi:quercetin dioxygenase-like cupin family protein
LNWFEILTYWFVFLYLPGRLAGYFCICSVKPAVKENNPSVGFRIQLFIFKLFIMKIIKNGAQPSAKANTDWFSGSVRIDPLFSKQESTRAAGALVTFEPGARTAWHTHPAGQTLIVISGVGRVQREGGPIEEIRPGDVVWFEPDEKHWHGPKPTKR